MPSRQEEVLGLWRTRYEPAACLNSLGYVRGRRKPAVGSLVIGPAADVGREPMRRVFEDQLKRPAAA
jgi:hypothetical protein